MVCDEVDMMKQFELKPYQQVLFDKMSAGGFKPGELFIFTAGRQPGKSMLNAMYGKLMEQSRPKFQVTDQALVDGATWYTITCVPEVGAWIRKQPKESQYAHIDKNWTIYQNWFDIHEELYSMLALRWT